MTEELTGQKADRLSGLLFAMSQPNRLRIVDVLTRSGELSVMDVGVRLALSTQGVSNHLATMRGAGLVACRRHGTFRFYQLTPLGTRAFAAFHDLLEEKD